MQKRMTDKALSTLVLGGARSGKSAHAERLAAASGKQVVYIATAQAHDAEMAARIALHQQQRPVDWITVQQPVLLAAALTEWCSPQRVVLVDCLTLWLSNLLFSEDRVYPEIGRIDAPACVEVQRGLLFDALAHAAGEVILVSNEVGMGIVPQGALARWFVDEAGRLNQAVAARCERALWVVAGLPLALKG